MIELPPSTTSENIEKYKELLVNKLSHPISEAVSRINHDYLYWTDVKYRAQPLHLTPKELWAIVKNVRSKNILFIPEFPDLHFSLTNHMQRQCHEFDMNFGGSWGAAKIFPEDKTTQEIYLVSSIMEEAIASSQMEGATTTREAAKDMLRRKINPRDKGQRMVLNNYTTINFIREHFREPLTPELILQIHGLMTENALDVPDAAGRLRREEENIVVGNGITGETVHTPPPANCLPGFLQDLCRFFNDSSSAVFIHPIIKAIIIHFLVGYYHPFADGNGRTARALFYWYMMKSNYWLVQYLSISRIIRGSKKAYEKAFLYTECDGNDMSYFIQYNLNVLHKSFEDLQKYLLRKNKEKRQSERLLHLGNITPRQAKVLNRYIENPDEVITSADLIHRLGISAGTAKSDLKDLTAKGYLTEISLNGKTKGYIRSPQFESMIVAANR